MPYKDKEQSRTYQRDYKRLRRAGLSQTPSQTQVPMEFRLKTATDVLVLIEEQVKAVKDDQALRTTERARVVGYLASVALRAIEAGNFVARVEASLGRTQTRWEGLKFVGK